MRTCFQRGVLTISVVALTGCTSLRVVLDVRAATTTERPALGQSLAQNDDLTLTKTDGSQLRIRLSELSEMSLTGVADHSPIKIIVPLSEVTRIERREFSGVKTVFLVFVIAVGVYAVAKAVGQAALASNI
jgi:hypothetical protein